MRDQAIALLAERAAKHDVDQAAPALAALVSLGGDRELAQLAKSAGPDAVRRQAVEALRDPKLLGSVARHAAEAGARLLAVGRLSDAAELEGVALRGEHADAAVAAVDRLEQPSAEQLAAIADKARTKAAQKRARALGRAFEAPAAPVADDTPAVVYREATRRRRGRWWPG